MSLSSHFAALGERTGHDGKRGSDQLIRVLTDHSRQVSDVVGCSFVKLILFNYLQLNSVMYMYVIVALLSALITSISME